MSENSQENTPLDHPPPRIPFGLTWEALTGRNNIDYNQPAKKIWPELVGLPAEEAEKKIKEEMEGASTPIVAESSFATVDFLTNRGRSFVDGAGKVTKDPRIG